MRRAVDHNPDLTVVRLGVDVEASRVTGSRSAFEPVFLATFGRSSITTPPSNAFFGTTGIDTSELFSSTGVRQRLPRGGGTWSVIVGCVANGDEQSLQQLRSEPPVRTSAGVLPAALEGSEDRSGPPPVHIAKRNHQSSELRFRESVVQTVAAVKQAYWTLKAAMANVSVQQRSLELARGPRSPEPRARQRRSGAAPGSRAGRGRGGPAAREPDSRRSRGPGRRGSPATPHHGPGRCVVLADNPQPGRRAGRRRAAPDVDERSPTR